MMTCDGYKMFHGTVKVSPVANYSEGAHRNGPFDLTGTWLFKPNTGYWYYQPDGIGLSRSYAPEILSDFRED